MKKAPLVLVLLSTIVVLAACGPVPEPIDVAAMHRATSTPGAAATEEPTPSGTPTNQVIILTATPSPSATATEPLPTST
jgi:hypothetical protein